MGRNAMSEVPQWAVRGDWFDVCSCDIPCPCEFAQPPTRNHCQGVLASYVREGHYGDVSLDGLNLLACGEFESNAWAGAEVTLALFMDERADPSQREDKDNNRRRGAAGIREIPVLDVAQRLGAGTSPGG
jgi:hypothetical protein